MTVQRIVRGPGYDKTEDGINEGLLTVGRVRTLLALKVTKARILECAGCGHVLVIEWTSDGYYCPGCDEVYDLKGKVVEVP